MKRSMFFVDGFNLYHALENNPKFHKYKWLNLRELALQFSKPPYESRHKNGYTITAINENFLAVSQFPNQINIGGKSYTKPPAWS